MDIAVIFALIAAFFFGLSNVLTKKGLDHQDVLQAVFISLLVNSVLMWILALFFVPLHLYLSSAIWIFVVAGFLAPGLARIFNVTAVKHLGVSRASPIIATSPIFSVVIALLFLGESFRIELLIATFVIIFGIYLLSTAHEDKSKGANNKYFIFALIAAIIYGIAAPIQKAGLSLLHYPILAATITTTTSLFIVAVYLAASNQLHLTRSSKSGTFFASLAGVSTGAAFFFNFSALNSGSVSAVTPVVSAYPLFALILSFFLLKQHEQINLKIVLGALSTVLGVIIITVF